MTHTRFYVLAALFVSATIFFGCATVLPPEYSAIENKPVLPGPILALAGQGDVLVAANPEGVYLREGNSAWEKLEVPGISDYRKISVLAVGGEDVCVGTDGEGLHILSGGVWEVKAARYGGLPDDHVRSIAYDGENDGFPGENLWVGTEKGIAVRSMGEWTIYEPKKRWLSDLTEKVSVSTGETYIGPGYKLGRRGADSVFFKPPVTAIAVGPDGVVFGSGNSRIAIVGPNGLATVHISGKAGISSLHVEENVIWAGTTGGLVWGGLSGKVDGTPWPSHRNRVPWMGRLFATRDARPFLYRWHLVGYNTAEVLSIARGGDSLWVVYGKPDSKRALEMSGADSSTIKPITHLRRFLNIEEYIARKDPFAYESYGKGSGIYGDSTRVLSPLGSGEVWIGTTKGLYHLEK